jgi:hypothetical protein
VADPDGRRDFRGWVYVGAGVHELEPHPSKTYPHRQRCRHCTGLFFTRTAVAEAATERCDYRKPLVAKIEQDEWSAEWVQAADRSARVAVTVRGVALGTWIIPEGCRQPPPYNVHDWVGGVVSAAKVILNGWDPTYLAALQQKLADKPRGLVIEFPRPPESA